MSQLNFPEEQSLAYDSDHFAPVRSKFSRIIESDVESVVDAFPGFSQESVVHLPSPTNPSAGNGWHQRDSQDDPDLENFGPSASNPSAYMVDNPYHDEEADQPVARKKRKGPQPKSRGWCFTWNNPSCFKETDSKEEQLNQLTAYMATLYVTHQRSMRYIIGGIERGESGTLHIQGYMYFVNAVTLSHLKGILPQAHFEMQRGTCEQARDYCKKDGQFVEYGEPPMSQNQKGLKSAEIFRTIIAHAERNDLDAIKSYHPSLYLRHYSTLQRIATSCLTKPCDLLDYPGIWIYGTSGSGKSHIVRALGLPFYDKLLNKWWDGYAHEPIVLLDDIDPENAKHLHGFFKRWTDIYSFTCEVKNGTKSYRPCVVIYTSQYSIAQVFGSNPESLEAMQRRCKSFEITRENRVLQLSVVKSQVEGLIDRRTNQLAPSV